MATARPKGERADTQPGTVTHIVEEPVTQVTTLEVQKAFEDIRKLYTAEKADNFSALIMSLPGSGKTTLIGTGRLPILLDSFDPKGPVVLRKLIAEGKVLVRDWSGDSSKNPTKYRAWEKQWEHDVRSGFLGYFGTYAIDSFTTFSDALSNEIAKVKKRDPGTLAIQDYQGLYATIRDMINLTSTQDCDFFLTAHIFTDKDDITGEITTEMMAYKGLRTSVPLLFSERYILIRKDSPAGNTFKLLTGVHSRYRASSRLASEGQLDLFEVPDIKWILKKVGRSATDKDLFLQEKGGD